MPVDANITHPRILLIEERESAFTNLRELIQTVWGGAATLTWVRSLDQASSGIPAGVYDVILLDNRLGTPACLQWLHEQLQRDRHTPVVLLADSPRYDLDLQAMQAGASEYLVTSELTATLLERAIRYAIVRSRAEAALRETEARARHMADYAQGLIESSLDIIVSVDLQRRIVEFNRAAEKAFGYARAEIVGQSVDRLYADVSESARMNEIIRHVGRFEGEVINRRKDGSFFPSFLSATWLRSLTGEAIGIMGISRDITVEKESDQKLREAADLLQRSHDDLLAILNQLTTGVILTEAGRVTFVNRACLDTLGVRNHEIVGHVWHEAFPLSPEDRTQVEAMGAKPAELRERVPVRITAPAGRSFWLELEVRDDPRGGRRRIVFVYDVSAVHDLRRMLSDKSRFHDLVGRSPAMVRVYEQIRDLAPVDATVLIEGETGTGKELVARALHSASRRADRTYVTVNCAGLSETLLGSQLFGHKRGAFTGAVEEQKGIFETADGGTVFLDEIGDISQSVQTMLLRVLQEKEITRLGEVKPRKVDVRILAATHRNLAIEVAAGRFRQDLLYRVRVARVQLPPLRERREDIPLLAETFLARCRASTGKDVRGVADDAMKFLLAYPWPGNVRELQSAVEIAVIHCRGSIVQPGDLPPEIAAGRAAPASAGLPIPIPPPPHLHGLRTDSTAPLASADSLTDSDERERILQALRDTRGNRLAAAKLLGYSRATLYRRLSELSINSADGRA